MSSLSTVFLNGRVWFTDIEDRSGIVGAIETILLHGGRLSDIEVMTWGNGSTKVLGGDAFVPKRKAKRVGKKGKAPSPKVSRLSHIYDL